MGAKDTADAIENIAQSASNQSMWWGAVTGIVGYLSSINWIGLSGSLAAILGLLVSSLIQIKRNRREAEARAEESRLNFERNRREEELHKEKIAAMREGRYIKKQ